MQLESLLHTLFFKLRQANQEPYWASSSSREVHSAVGLDLATGELRIVVRVVHDDTFAARAGVFGQFELADDQQGDLYEVRLRSTLGDFANLVARKMGAGSHPENMRFWLWDRAPGGPARVCIPCYVPGGEHAKTPISAPSMAYAGLQQDRLDKGHAAPLPGRGSREDLCLFLETLGPRGAQRLQQPRSELLLFLKAFDPTSSHPLQYGGSLLAAAATPGLADLHQLMREQVGWPDSWGLDVFAETWAAGSCSLRLLPNQASLADLGLRHGDVLCYQRTRQDPQQGGIVEFWGSVRDVTFRQLDADGEVMQGTGLRVQLPGTSLCSEVTSAIRAAGQMEAGTKLILVQQPAHFGVQSLPWDDPATLDELRVLTSFRRGNPAQLPPRGEARQGEKVTGSRAKSRSLDGSQENGAVPPVPLATGQPQPSSGAGPDAAAIVQSLRASLDGSRQQRGQIDKLLTTMRADVSSLPPGAAGTREKAALHERSMSAYHQELKALREEHDDYEALKLKHASAAAQLVVVSEQMAAAGSLHQGLEARLADSQQKLAEADAAAEERLQAMKVSLEAAAAASALHQKEHAKLQTDLTGLREQLAAAESCADELRSTNAHHEMALREQHDRAVAADQVGQDRLAQAQDEAALADRRVAAAVATVQQLEASLAAVQMENTALHRDSEAHKLEASEHGTQYVEFSRQLEDAAAALATKADALATADKDRARQGMELESLRQQLLNLQHAHASQQEQAAQQHEQELGALREEVAGLQRACAESQEISRQLKAVQQDLSSARAESAASASQQNQLEQRAHAAAQESNRRLEALQQDLIVARAESAASMEQQAQLEQQMLQQQQQHQHDAHVAAGSATATAAAESHAVVELQNQLRVEKAKAEATVFARDRMKTQLQDLQGENSDLKDALERAQQQLQAAAPCQTGPAESSQVQELQSDGMHEALLAEGNAAASQRLDTKQTTSDVELQEAAAPAAFVTLRDGSQLEAAAVQEMQRTLRSSTQEQQVLKQEIAALRGELDALQAGPVRSGMGTWPCLVAGNSQDLAHMPSSTTQLALEQPPQASRTMPLPVTSVPLPGQREYKTQSALPQDTTARTIPELLLQLAPDRPLQERVQACDRLLPMVIQAGLEDGLAPTDAPQLLASLLTLLQLQPTELPTSLFRLLQDLAKSPGHAKTIIRGPSLDRLAALLRQVDTEALLSILALLDALAGHAKYLSEFAKSNVIFELLAILEDLKPKSAGKRRAASLLLMTLFSAPPCCEQVVLLGAQHQLVHILGESQADMAQQAAALLWRLAANSPDRKDSVAASGAIPPLVSLLGFNTTTSTAQAPAAAALDSLAYRSLAHRQEMAAAGVIPPLVAFLQHSLTSPPDPTLPAADNPFAPDQPMRPALNLLHSLALDSPGMRRELAGCGAIPLLTALMGAQSGAQSSPMQLAQAAGVLSRMAADGQDFRDAIMSAGAVPALVGTLQDPGASPAGQEQALGALEVLAAGAPACSAAIVSAGGVPAVIQLLNVAPPHLQRRAAATLAALAADEGAVLPGVQVSTAVQKLADLVLTPPDPDTQVLAVSALCRLPLGQDPQLAQTAARCIPAAVWMCSGTGGAGPRAAQEAVILLQLLAQQQPMQEGLRAAGAVAALAQHIGAAEGPPTQARALQGVLLLCQANPGACEQAVQAGCIEAAFAHVSQASPEFQAATASLADTVAISLPGSDARIQACGGIQLLTQLMGHGPPGVQGPATAALAALCAPSLATSQSSCQFVLASDALHYLGPLLDASDLRARTSVLALLCPLSWQGPEASRAISAIIGLYRLIGLLEIPAPELQCWTLSVLGNVAMAEASSQSGSTLEAAVPAIVALLEAWHQDAPEHLMAELQRQAATTVGILATLRSLQAAVAAGQAVSALQRVLQAGARSPAAYQACVAALNRLHGYL
ncbi:hypothetical protein WJX74_009116 [Apatococcus lobatus]|uniref:Ubiquitin carboxyl-terminal hydrolase 7 ICP0-binding domain-containing protein n=1 Tax=Apatococcus lobatus TaxID=904363 RepID=A0AAW1SFL2_9CHLO